VYALLATAWWQWLFLPATIIMGSLQGMAVNWWAHKFRYKNYKLTNTSKNILPFDFISGAKHIIIIIINILKDLIMQRGGSNAIWVFRQWYFYKNLGLSK